MERLRFVGFFQEVVNPILQHPRDSLVGGVWFLDELVLVVQLEDLVNKIVFVISITIQLVEMHKAAFPHFRSSRLL